MRPFFSCKRKRFRLSFVSGKKDYPQPEHIDDCTIPGFKDPPPRTGIFTFAMATC